MGVRSSLLFKYFYSVLHFLIDLRGYLLINLEVLNFFLMRGGHTSIVARIILVHSPGMFISLRIFRNITRSPVKYL